MTDGVRAPQNGAGGGRAERTLAHRGRIDDLDREIARAEDGEAVLIGDVVADEQYRGAGKRGRDPAHAVALRRRIDGSELEHAPALEHDAIRGTGRADDARDAVAHRRRKPTHVHREERPLVLEADVQLRGDPRAQRAAERAGGALRRRRPPPLDRTAGWTALVAVHPHQAGARRAEQTLHVGDRTTRDDAEHRVVASGQTGERSAEPGGDEDGFRRARDRQQGAVDVEDRHETAPFARRQHRVHVEPRRAAGGRTFLQSLQELPTPHRLKSLISFVTRASIPGHGPCSHVVPSHDVDPPPDAAGVEQA